MSDADDLVLLRAKAAELRAQLDAERSYVKQLEADLLQLHARLATLERSAAYRFARALTSPLRRVPVAEEALLKLRWTVAPLLHRAVGAAKVAWRTRTETRPVTAPPTHLVFAGEVPGLVSVVLPVFNQASLLRESAESVLAQTWRELELVIVNDGSRDDVAPVLRALAAADARVRVVTQPNQGLPKALSNGFQLALGEWWTWTSADNLMEPRQLERLVAALRANPSAGLVYADYTAIDDRGQPLVDPEFRKQNRRLPTSSEIHLPRDAATLISGRDNFIGPCFLYRGHVGRRLGEYDPSMGIEDYDYWMRVLHLYGIAHLGDDEPLYRYRVHDNTLSARAGEHKILARVDALFAHEGARAAAYAAPWRTLADDEARAQLGGGVERFAGELPAAGKTLLFVGAAALEALPEPLPAHVCVAAWIDSPAALHRYRVALATRAHLCFVADAPLLALAGLYHAQAYLAPDGAEALRAAQAYADNFLFYRATHAEAARARATPELFVDEGAPPLHVMLQVDDFVQGGLEQVILDQARTLRELGARVSLCILGRRGEAAARAVVAGLELLALPPGGHRELLASARVDVVNAHFSTAGAEECAQAGVPFVQTVHNSYTWLVDEQIAAQQRAGVHTAAFACVSRAVALYSAERLGLPAERMIVMANGVDTAALPPRGGAEHAALRRATRASLGLPDDAYALVNVASVYEVKSQLPMVKALGRLLSSHPKARLLLAGRVMDLRYAERVRAAARELGCEAAVLWLGHRDDMHAVYAAADAFLLPSYWEGDSLAAAEAACAGLPLLLSDAGSARELLAAVGGELIELPYDSILDVRADTIRRFVDDDERLTRSLITVLGRVLTSPPPAPTLDARARVALDRRVAYRRYLRLFRWLRQGGRPAALRHLPA